LVGGIHTAGGGSDILFFAAPQQAAAIKLRAGAGFDYPVIDTPSLAAGVVIAIEARAFASGFSDIPRVDIAREATINWETAPAQIGTVGTPNVVAAPSRNGFADYTHAIRLVLRAAWGMRGPGFVQYITGSTY
jgi:hypothetical protein